MSDAGPEDGRGPATEPGGRAAAFVDRDGTIIREREYLSDPAGVELLPGAAEGLAVLEAAGYAIVVVTNQSGIARGLYDEAAYRAVQAEMVRRLQRFGVHVERSYHCPHHPDITGVCDCRKPAPGLFLRAAGDLGIDLESSLFIGDRLRDVEAAALWNGRAFLVRTGYGEAEAPNAPPAVTVVADLGAAARSATSGSDVVDTSGDPG